MRDIGTLKVALVHDFLLYPGGAEKVLEALCEMFPEAPIYTLLYDKQKMRGKFADREIRTSFLQKFPLSLRKRYRLLLPLMPTTPETFDLREFDLVISSTGAWSKGIVTKLNTIHVAYIHSPMRFAWEISSAYPKGQNFFLCLLLSYLRLWDFEAAQRPDYLVANSKYTQERIKKYYRRESVVIYPPAVDIASQTERNINSMSDNKPTNLLGSFPDDSTSQGYFLIVSRLSPYKKVDLVIEAFNKLELPLVVIGEGRQYRYLKKIARKNIKILGWQSDEKLAQYYQNARALVFPTDDDFGLVPVEAMSYGVPVIALRKGGALETVVEGVTGEFFDAQTPEVLADGVRRFMEKESSYNKEVIRKRAEEFSEERFKNGFLEYISEKIGKIF